MYYILFLSDTLFLYLHLQLVYIAVFYNTYFLFLT
jgi:hypothetical protein